MKCCNACILLKCTASTGVGITGVGKAGVGIAGVGKAGASHNNSPVKNVDFGLLTHRDSAVKNIS